MNNSFDEIHEGDRLSARWLNDVAGNVSRLSRPNRGRMRTLNNQCGMFTIPEDEGPTQLVHNNSGVTIPAYGCIRVSSFYGVDDTQVIYEGDKPNAFGSQYTHVFNGPVPLPAGEIGPIQMQEPFTAAYDTNLGVTPGFGYQWGPRSGGFLLEDKTQGFRVMAVDATDSIVYVTRCPFLRFKGQTGGAINQGSSGSVTIFIEYGGTILTTSQSMANVVNDFANVGSGKNVECVWDGDIAGILWRLVAAQC